jgi:hypothetical protein
LGEGPPVFEHVTILLSFVYAVALTHLLSSATELVIARKRVRFSGLYAAWVLIAALLLLINWLSLWGLTALKHWTVAEVLLQFTTAIVQYFTCSTLRVSEGRDDDIDLPTLYEERRPLISSAFLALALIAIFQNWWDRNNMVGVGPNDWIGEDLSIAPMFVFVPLAGWARARWLQWIGTIALFSLSVFFLLAYAMPGA